MSSSVQDPYWAIDIRAVGQRDGDTIVTAQAELTKTPEQPPLYGDGVAWETLKSDLIENGFKLFSTDPDMKAADDALAKGKDIKGWLVGTVTPAKLKVIGFKPK